MNDESRPPVIPEVRPTAPLSPAPIPGRPVVTPGRRRRPLRRLLGLLVIVLLIGGGFFLYRHFTGATPATGGRGAQAASPQSVGVATIGTGDIRVVLSQLGTVTPLDTVTVKTQISGYLTHIAFEEGQEVHEGDFLAQIDPRPYQVALEQAQGTLATQQALLQNAQTDAARYRKLASQDSISNQQEVTQAALVRQYQGTLITDQAAIDSAKLNLAYCHITSPVTGRVGLRQVDQGNYVQTSDTNGLVVITQLHPISVVFTLPEDSLVAVSRGMRAGTLSVTALDRANVTQLATGTLATLDNQVDTTTGTVKARAIFQNTDDALFPNQFVNANLLVQTLHDVVRVPSAGIQRGAPGTYVYLVGAGDTVSVHPIKLGPSDGDLTAVTSGLAAGDRVVIDGADRLRDGQKVAVAAPASAKPAADAATPAAADGEAAPAAGQRRHHRPHDVPPATTAAP